MWSRRTKWNNGVVWWVKGQGCTMPPQSYESVLAIPTHPFLSVKHTQTHFLLSASHKWPLGAILRIPQSPTSHVYTSAETITTFPRTFPQPESLLPRSAFLSPLVVCLWYFIHVWAGAKCVGIITSDFRKAVDQKPRRLRRRIRERMAGRLTVSKTGNCRQKPRWRLTGFAFPVDHGQRNCPSVLQRVVIWAASSIGGHLAAGKS